MSASMTPPRYKHTKTIIRGIYLSIGIIIVVGGAGYLIWNGRSLIDSQITEEASFAVYTPKQAPSGYVLDKNKTKLSKDTLTYVLVNKSNDKDIIVTVQPIPKNFDMKKLIGSGTVTTTSTPNGALYDLSASGKSQYLLNTGDSLIFFTSTHSIDAAAINTLATDMVKRN